MPLDAKTEIPVQIPVDPADVANVQTPMLNAPLVTDFGCISKFGRKRHNRIKRAVLNQMVRAANARK